MSWLLDTNVVSEPTKKRCAENVVEWLDSLREGEVFISVITLGEIEEGIVALGDGARKQKLLGWLSGGILQRFGQRILPVSISVARRWGTLLAHAPRTLSVSDSLIAATALEHSLTIATRNVADFDDTGARVFDPWTFTS